MGWLMDLLFGDDDADDTGNETSLEEWIAGGHYQDYDEVSDSRSWLAGGHYGHDDYWDDTNDVGYDQDGMDTWH